MERRGYESINAELANARRCAQAAGDRRESPANAPACTAREGAGRAPAPHAGERLRGRRKFLDARRALYDSGWRRNVSFPPLPCRGFARR